MNILLVGNPNCGKTTLFNELTGSFRKTGNFAGVTTDVKSGELKKGKGVTITDIPGIYSLSPNSADSENAVREIKKAKADVIINVIDGTDLERSLYLTALLSKQKIPTVIAVNMYDDLLKNGVRIDDKRLSTLFGMPVVLISALKKINLKKLVSVAENHRETPKINIYNDEKEIFSFIEKNINKIIVKKPTKRETLTRRIDGVLLNKYLGIPALFLIITAVYFLTFRIGGVFTEILEKAIDNISVAIKTDMERRGLSEWFISLLTGAVINGVGSVFSFLPQILILFTLMAIIEESGYAARIAFLTDSVFRRVGLGGKSVIPLVLSCGCTVSGITATRTIENPTERKRTIFLTAFMPCGAKTAVFGWLSFVLFGGNPFVPAIMYFSGIAATIVFGKLLLKTDKNKTESGFFLEMPNYRFPSVKDIYRVLIDKTREFLLKAGSVVFLVSVILWFLKNFGFSGYGAGEKSFLFSFGNALKYLFYPLGFGNAEATVSLMSGILAKESVAETLRILSCDVPSLFASPFSAAAFMAFLLLSPPCIAALSAARNELGKKEFIKMIAFQFFAGYVVAFLINLFGLVFYAHGLILYLITVIIVVVTGILFFRMKKRRGLCAKKRVKRNTTI